MKGKTVISIVGPTAVGKTATSIELAKLFDAEIISSDSRQFYKEISIGTAKPSLEELQAVPHHFINNLSITEDYNASKFEKDVLEFLDVYFKHKDTIILCGGSGMYVDAVLKGFDSEVPSANEELRTELNTLLAKKGLAALQNRLNKTDPKAYEKIDTQNSKRLMRAIEICELTGKTNEEVKRGVAKERPFKTIKVGLELPRHFLYERINLRVDKMMIRGLLDEVKSVALLKDKNALKTVGYKELFQYFNHEITLEQAVEKIKVNSRRYAKRQLTWFKKDEHISWFTPNEINKISKYIRSIIQKQ